MKNFVFLKCIIITIFFVPVSATTKYGVGTPYESTQPSFKQWEICPTFGTCKNKNPFSETTACKTAGTNLDADATVAECLDVASTRTNPCVWSEPEESLACTCPCGTQRLVVEYQYSQVNECNQDFTAGQQTWLTSPCPGATCPGGSSYGTPQDQDATCTAKPGPTAEDTSTGSPLSCVSSESTFDTAGSNGVRDKCEEFKSPIYANGDYVLTAIIDGAKGTWDYAQPIWTDNTVYDAGGEKKTRAFSTIKSNKIRVHFEHGSCIQEFDYEHNLDMTLSEIFASGEHIGKSPGRSAWTGLGCGDFAEQTHWYVYKQKRTSFVFDTLIVFLLFLFPTKPQQSL